MKVYTPSYYNKFECKKGGCAHSCCIGWEIDIDDKTKEKYKNVSGEFGKKLKKEIENGHFLMDENKRCPFLNKNNLCDIYINLGKDALCQICSDHPRFTNVFEDREEIGLGLSCEACVDIILEEKEKAKIEPKNEQVENEFFTLRQRIFDILQNRSETVQNRIKTLIKEFDVTIPEKSTDEWAEFLLSLEILSDDWKNLLENLKENENFSFLSEEKWQIALEQLIVYFVYRYVKPYDLSVSHYLAFCIVNFNLILEIFKKSNDLSFDSFKNIVRMYSAEIEYSPQNTEDLMFEIQFS